MRDCRELRIRSKITFFDCNSSWSNIDDSVYIDGGNSVCVYESAVCGLYS